MRSDAIAVIAIRISYRVENIEKSYNKNFQRWLYVQSHEKEILSKDQYGWEGLVFDENGFITNATFSKKTISGFDLLEQDFIKEELKRINAVKTQSLDLDDQKYIEFVKAYFENREPDNKPKEKKTKRSYTTKHFVFTYLLDCKALNRPLYEGVKNDYLTGFASNWSKFKEEAKTKPSTFKRLIYEYENEKLTEKNLNNLLGEDWQSIVLELSDDPQTLKAYLDTIA